MSEQTYLVLVRHGETEWSRTGQHTGTTDLPLLPDGEASARRAGEILSRTEFVKAYSSPLLRARETARLAGFGDVEIDDDLREWDYGAYEGLTTPEIRERCGDPDWEIFAGGVEPGRTPGETVEDVSARASHVLLRVRPWLEQGNVVLFAHGHLLRILGATWVQQQPRFGAQLELDAGGVCLLGTHHDVPTLTVWNRRTLHD